MKKVTLSVDQQVLLLNALGQLDSYESVTPGVEKGPKVVQVRYKLGSQRRVLVKNINTLKASLASFDEVRASLFKEIFPDVAEGAGVTRDEAPEAFDRFQEELKNVAAAKEQFELLPFKDTVLYSDENEFPSAALALLDEFGLIEETP